MAFLENQYRYGKTFLVRINFENISKSIFELDDKVDENNLEYFLNAIKYDYELMSTPFNKEHSKYIIERILQNICTIENELKKHNIYYNLSELWITPYEGGMIENVITRTKILKKYNGIIQYKN